MAPDFGKPIHQLPLIPNVLKKLQVHEPLDTRFRSAARLLQALWREDRDLPSAATSTRTANAANSAAAFRKRRGKGGGNFLTAEIAHTARSEAAYREVGALIGAERLATNLLSSMPLAFNLLAPWGHTPERASGYLLELLPAFTGSAQEGLQQPISKVMPCRPPVRNPIFEARCAGAAAPKISRNLSNS